MWQAIGTPLLLRLDQLWAGQRPIRSSVLTGTIQHHSGFDLLLCPMRPVHRDRAQRAVNIPECAGRDALHNRRAPRLRFLEHHRVEVAPPDRPCGRVGEFRILSPR